MRIAEGNTFELDMTLLENVRSLNIMIETKLVMTVFAGTNGARWPLDY